MIDVDPTKSESAARVAIRKYLYLVLGSIATVGVIAAIALAPIIGTGRLKENGKAIAHTYRLEKNLQDVLVMLRPVEINVGRYHLPSDSIPFGSIKTSLENLETERRPRY